MAKESRSAMLARLKAMRKKFGLGEFKSASNSTRRKAARGGSMPKRKRASHRRSFGGGIKPMLSDALLGLGVGSLLGGTDMTSRALAGGVTYLVVKKSPVAAISAAAAPEIYGVVSPVTAKVKGAVGGAVSTASAGGW